MHNRSLKDEIAEYWTVRAASFDTSPGHGIASGGERDAWRALLRAGLGSLDGQRVLEPACGTGEFTALLLDAGAVVTGVDLSEGMLARGRAKLRGRPAALFTGDAEDTREPAGTYDAVACRHLVWTLPDPAAALADWFRVLRPGGRLLVVDGDWVRLPWHGRLRRALGQALARLPGAPPDPVDWAAHERIMAQVHFRDGLRAEALARLVRTAGFATVRTGTLAAVRREQRRTAGFPHSLTVGMYEEFWMAATKPA